MDKNAIKKFAIWARRELISRVSQRAAWYGITEKDPIDEKLQAVHGHVLTPEEQAQRQALIGHIRKNGYQQVMEEVAYTWFNRFIALRFMEVNGYLPSYTRVFSDENGAFNPQILKDAIHLELEGLDMEKVYALEEANETEALFKYLVITQCNDLNRMLPGMFQKISDYTELLFPDFLLREGSVAHQMVTTIPEDDWKDAVQIIGWLYQYYNTEPNEVVYDGNMSKNRIPKELVPAATTIYTPDWTVRYMVENSLGRFWVAGHPNDELKAKWKYYLQEGLQEPEVEEQLKKIRAGYAQIDPASILCVDPCMGSGHILVYMFDVLMQIYLAYGYTVNEAVESIVRNNLWGMDIDDRAAQMAYFAVMMKAQQYDHRWLAKQVRHSVQPKVFALQDSGDWPTFERQMQQAFTHHPSLMEEASIKTAKTLFETFADAKEYGSIIQPEISLEELNMLESTLDEMRKKADLMDFVAQADAATLLETLKPQILQCRALVQKYHVVVTNPPYLGSGRFSAKLDGFVKTNYPDEKADLSMVMYKQALSSFVNKNGFVAFITTTSWMFLSSFEKIRKYIFDNSTIVSLVDFGTELFEGKVGHNPIVSWITQNSRVNYTMTAIRLVDFCYSRRDEKEGEFFNKKNYYSTDGNTFSCIPGSPITYWVGEKIFWAFRNAPALKDIARARSGAKTGKNDLFIMNWWEVNSADIGYSIQSYAECKQSSKKWFPHNKGGNFRNWYGNRELVIRFERGGEVIREYAQVHGNAYDINATDVFFHEGLTWTALTSYKNSFRYSPSGCVFDTNKGPMLFNDSHELLMYLLGFMVSPVAQFILKALNQSLSLQNGDVDKVPLIIDKDNIERIAALSQENVDIAKLDYDEIETSFDFLGMNLVPGTVSDNYITFKNQKEIMFERLKNNTEAINRFFISLYGVDTDVSSQVEEKDILSSCSIPDESIYARRLVSYAVGCILGRYSLNKHGLAFAGGIWDAEPKNNCSVDYDGILPITDDEYFNDDIVGIFINWMQTVFGADTFEDNLQFIAKGLGGSGSSRDVIRQYFLNGFYQDHLRLYQRCPIYWLFDSGKKNGFKCLIYMHRYQPDTIARIRTDYLHETQARYRNAIETLERQSASASTSERVKMTKRLNALKAQAEEARIYEEKIHHLADQMIKIDLDDGVKVNYAKFADVLAPIK